MEMATTYPASDEDQDEWRSVRTGSTEKIRVVVRQQEADHRQRGYEHNADAVDCALDCCGQGFAGIRMLSRGKANEFGASE